MQATQSPKKIRAPPRARKSIAHLPSPDVNTEKENLTVDSAAVITSVAQGKPVAKKLRSKSIGPGGLDALKEDAGNRRLSTVAPFKSILKPTIPLSPPKQIPPRSRSQRDSPNKPKPKTTSEKSQTGSLLDASIWKSSNPANGNQELPNSFEGSSESNIFGSALLSPSQHRTRIAVRTEEQQQAAVRERERQEALAHKDARRKPLANRRVSFAPEATLHTWDVVELPEDSTTSSASTNSTRRDSNTLSASTNSTPRASSLSRISASPYTQDHSPVIGTDVSETPSTPPPEPTEIQIAASPAHQRDLHQKKRGRSSGIPPMNFNNPNDFSSSPSDGESVIDDDNGTEPFITADEEVESSNSDDDDSVEDPSISSEFDANDVTAPSNGDSSTSSSDKLEAALRQAANQAGTQGIDYDENGDITMELVDDEVTSAFQPWMKKGKYVPHSMNDLSILQTQENTNPFSPAFKACVSEMHLVDDVERTMEFTQAVGAILPTKTDLPCSPKGNRPKSASDSQRRSSGASQQSSGGDSMIGDETMDLTTAVGKIQSNAHAPEAFRNTGDDGSVNEDEELTMEFTSVFGGLIGQNKQPENMKKPLIENYLEIQQIPESGNQRQSKEPSHHEDGIDVAFTASNILPSITERTEPLEDQTSGMDIPAAVGAILPPVLSAGSKSQAKLLMEREIDAGQLSGSSFQAGFPVAPSSSNHVATVASETGSPSLMTAQRRSNAKKSLLSRHSTTPKASSRQSTPSKKPVTPSKQETPLVVRPTTPGKTPPSKNIAMRTGSPKKLFKAEIRAENSTPKSLSSISLVNKGEESSDIVPKFMLKPEIRRASGLGIDREGLGSPRVTALLNRRRSIGEDAMVFTPQNQAQRGVRFENPKVMKEELERQWAEDERRESRRGTLQTETDSQELDEEKDVTTSLKDMIESLTPKKKRLNGRKSLHVGAAKGLLGKRPAELDDDEDEDSSPKRIKGREGSPVKKVRLPAPPSKIETTGRITRSVRRSLTEAGCDNNADTATKPLSPLKKPHISKPGVQPRSTDAEESASAGKSLVLVDKVHAENPIIPNLSEEEDRIHLQEFLNMTSIRFMELTTTKRRLTVAPTNILESSAKKPGKATGIDSATDRESELESCVVAGGCTIPMLELYQHSCRELKRYIAEGRSIVREIEADTFEENPPLFREYMCATPEVKQLMDNQFKNVKTHARLLSKAMWYEWRMKLLEGLKEGLLKVREGMDEDEDKLEAQEIIIESVLPNLILEHEQSEVKYQTLRLRANEFASFDLQELKEARDSLAAIEDELQGKQKVLNVLQNEVAQKEDELEYAVKRRQQYLDEIKEVEKTCQESRSWSISDIATLQADVGALETAHGWMITSSTGSSLTMSYKETLQLFFAPSSFMPNCAPASQSIKTENCPISLTYVADIREYHPQTLSTEKRFFLQIMRAQLQCLPHSQTRLKDLLNFISGSWEKASKIAEESRVLMLSHITDPTIASDEVMNIHSVLLLRDMKTKVEVGFEVSVRSHEKLLELNIAVKPSAKVVYGKEFKEKMMVEFLEMRIGKGVEVGVWARAVKELEERLIAMGGK